MTVDEAIDHIYSTARMLNRERRMQGLVDFKTLRPAVLLTRKEFDRAIVHGRHTRRLEIKGGRLNVDMRYAVEIPDPVYSGALTLYFVVVRE